MKELKRVWKKKAETAELAAKVEELRAKLGKAAGQVQARFVVEAAGKDVRIANLLKWLESAQPGGPAVKVIVIDKDTGRIIMEKGPPPPVPAPPMPAGQLQGQFELKLDREEGQLDRRASGRPDAAAWRHRRVHRGGGVFTPSTADGDKRIDELEHA